VHLVARKTQLLLCELFDVLISSFRILTAYIDSLRYPVRTGKCVSYFGELAFEFEEQPTGLTDII